MKRKIAELRPLGAPIFCAYGDCGTGGELDRVLADEGVERLPGAHCYAFYAGLERFDALPRKRSAPSTSPISSRAISSASSSGASASTATPNCSTTISATTRGWSIWRRRRRPTSSTARERAAAFLKLPLQIHETGFGLLDSEVRRRVA